MAGRVATEVTIPHPHEFLSIGITESCGISEGYYPWISITRRKESKKFSTKCRMCCHVIFLIGCFTFVMTYSGDISNIYCNVFVTQWLKLVYHRLYGDLCLILYLYSYITFFLQSTYGIERRKRERERHKKNNKSLPSVVIEYSSAWRSDFIRLLPFFFLSFSQNFWWEW